ncbi:hypothetical protein NFJ02_15g20330 [Pycnococcus provasolii]
MPPAPVCVCAICLAGTHEPNDLPLDERGTRLRRRMRVGLAKLYLIAMHNRNRKATHGQHLAGVRALQRFGDLINRRVLPCTAVTMREFIMHELATLKLDSSTVSAHPDGRPYLCINVDTDKNIKAGGGRIAVVPCDIPALGIRPVDDVRSYILEARPPNGPAAGFFLSAPKSVKLMTFNSGMYTGFARVWRDTFRKLFPTALDRKIASHSGRKTLATLLWNDGYCRRFVADVGAWFCKSDAVDLYFATSRERILFALRHLGEGSGFSSRR